MFGHDYYYGSIRKYVALFGTLFNDIHVIRDNTSRNLKQTIKVPVTYGPREKVLARLTQDPDLNRMPAITLPRMSFEITNVTYAATRKLNTVGRRVAQNQDYPSKLNYAYNPVPYDIAFTLSIIVKNADDGAQIVEQILPFFTPEWTTTVELIPELNAVYDIPLVLNDVRSEDNLSLTDEEGYVLVQEEYDLGTYDPIASNDDIETFADTFIDFTERDPFSEGAY